MNLKMLSVTMFAGVVAASAIVPAAFAQDGSGGSAAGGTTSTTVSSLPSGRVPMNAGGLRVRLSAGLPGARPDFAGDHGMRRGPEAKGGVFDAVATALGVTGDELRSLLADGSTPLVIATARGLDATKFTADVTAAVRANIEQAVTNGDLPRERADAMLADLDEHVASMLSSAPPAGGPDEGGRGPREGRGPRAGDVLGAAATALGVTADDLRTQLADGSTILDIATARGLDATQFTADVTAAVRAEISRAVTDGTIPQEMADRVLSGLDARVAGALSSIGPRGGHGPGGDCDGGPATEQGTTTRPAATQA